MKERNDVNPILSVIIPVYNAEAFLQGCLNLFADDEEWYEVIIVDDGSKDNSLKICYQFQKLWKHIHVIHQENSGVSVARNVGIENALGKWICFIDSDDYILDDWKLTIQHAITKELNADILIFSKNIEERQYSSEDCVKGALGFLNNLGKNGKTLSWGVSKLYLRSLLMNQDIRFIPGLINGEDMLFNCNAFSRANKIVGINKSYYCYYKNMQSATNRFNPNIVHTELLFHKSLKKIMDINGYNDNEWKVIYDVSLLTGLFAILYRIGLSKGKKLKNVLFDFLDRTEYINALNKLDEYQKYISPSKKMPLYLLKFKMVGLAVLYAKIFCFVKIIYYRKNRNGIEEAI